jgi:hypothetical protein
VFLKLRPPLSKLDSQTLAVITDDGPVPYRPLSDTAWLVTWLQHELRTVELQPGGALPSDQG